MKKITALFVFVFLFAATNVHAQGGWRFIADKMVAFGVDHDVIVTGNTNDDFRKLKLRVTDGPLKMYDMKVIRAQIRQGGESRVIDLDGGLRHIRRIEFWYETKGFRKGRSRVAVWGYK